ncbi:hypothetical protein GA0115255_115112 [Streptomyces sp. Ncost-T6T-2b]|nr:hypothetical protein GA0115255_115112 [Streptomyces sp. Ncost-T6T-2b]
MKGRSSGPVRVGQEAAVDDQVGVDGQAVLVAEGHHRGPQLRLGLARELGVHLGPQLVHVEAGGVDDQVGVAAQLAQQVALGRDAVDDAPVALEGVRAADGLEAAHEGVVGGLQEDDPPGDVLGLQVREGFAEVVEEAPASYVDDDGDPGHVALGAGAELRPWWGSSAGGRLSTTNQPRSSRHLAAVLRPAPDIPEMITSSGMAASPVSFGVFVLTSAAPSARSAVSAVSEAVGSVSAGPVAVGPVAFCAVSWLFSVMSCPRRPLQ